MIAMLAFKLVCGLLAIGAATCGIVAARRSYQAANVPVDPGWTLPGQPGRAQPGTYKLQQIAWTGATLDAIQKSGAMNRAAVRWTIAAVLIGTGASLASLFPISN